MKRFAQLISGLGLSLAFVSGSGSALAAAPAKKPVKAADDAAAASESGEKAGGEDAKTTAAESPAAKQKKIKYKTGKQVDFDKQTIQGELRRPEISVVTGNEKTTDNGILRLREDFVDRITAHAAEEVE